MRFLFTIIMKYGTLVLFGIGCQPDQEESSTQIQIWACPVEVKTSRQLFLVLTAGASPFLGPRYPDRVATGRTGNRAAGEGEGPQRTTRVAQSFSAFMRREGVPQAAIIAKGMSGDLRPRWDYNCDATGGSERNGGQISGRFTSGISGGKLLAPSPPPER